MEKIVRSSGLDLDRHFDSCLKPALKIAGWILRVTDRSDKPSPVFIVKEHLRIPGEKTPSGKEKKTILDRGILFGDALVRLLPIVRKILSGIRNEQGIPLEAQRYIEGLPVAYRGNLPLDEEAGFKLALMFKLQERLRELDRVELLARRVEKFSREEAAYWYSRISDFSTEANRWAQAGLRIVLAGQPHDPAIRTMLERLRRN